MLNDFDNEAIVGGGIWPEPFVLDPSKERASFFWAKNNVGGLDLLDDFNDPKGNGYHNESWYKSGRTLKAGECSWSSAYLDIASNRTMVTCTVKIERDGNFWGVATTDIVLTNIDSILLKQNEVTGGYAFVVDNENQIISFPKIRSQNFNLVMLNDLASKDKSLSELTAAIASNNQISPLSEKVLGGESSILVKDELEGQGWTIGMIISEDIALSSLHAVKSGLYYTLIPLVILFAFLIYFFGQKIISAINRTTAQIDILRTDSSQQKLIIRSNDEIGVLQQAVNKYGDYLSAIVEEVQKESLIVKQNSGGLLALSEKLSNRSNEQSQENAQLAAAIHEMSASADEVSETTQNAADTAENSVSSVDSGRESVSVVNTNIGNLSNALNKANTLIQSLADDSTQVGNVLSVIKNISEQTNLLALNAAIEAARAGEQGRGFAVVADEVRSLASKTQDSATEIDDMINQLQHRAHESVQVINSCHQMSQKAVDNTKEVEENFSLIQHAFDEIKDRTLLIANSSSEQARVTLEISELAVRIKDISEMNAEDANQLKEVSQQSTLQAERLHSLSNQS